MEIVPFRFTAFGSVRDVVKANKLPPVIFTEMRFGNGLSVASSIVPADIDSESDCKLEFSLRLPPLIETAAFTVDGSVIVRVPPRMLIASRLANAPLFAPRLDNVIAAAFVG